jgi:hypothetical protein
MAAVSNALISAMSGPSPAAAAWVRVRLKSSYGMKRMSTSVPLCCS